MVGIVIAKFLLRGWENCNLEHYSSVAFSSFYGREGVKGQ